MTLKDILLKVNGTFDSIDSLAEMLGNIMLENKLADSAEDAAFSLAILTELIGKAKALDSTPGEYHIIVRRAKDLFGDNNEDYIEVSGYMQSYGKTAFALEYEPWSVWLLSSIAPKSLVEFDEEVILAACIVEMTQEGNTEEVIKAQYDSLLKQCMDIANDEGISLEELVKREEELAQHTDTPDEPDDSKMRIVAGEFSTLFGCGSDERVGNNVAALASLSEDTAERLLKESNESWRVYADSCDEDEAREE